MNQTFKKPLYFVALCVLIGFILIAIYAPFLASSHPLFVEYDGKWYFPLFRELFYPGYYTKIIDRFYNLLIFIAPLGVISWFVFKNQRKMVLLFFTLLQVAVFGLITLYPPKNPARVAPISLENQLNWRKELEAKSSYAKLNLLIDNINKAAYQEKLESYNSAYKIALEKRSGKALESDKWLLPTLYNSEQKELEKQTIRLTKIAKGEDPNALLAQKRLKYNANKQDWITEESKKVTRIVMPLIRPFGYQEDAGGNQLLNQQLSWYDLSRVNRKDLTAALIFGTRISLMVGLASVAIALAIGIPLGAFAGYYGGKLDLALSRLLEVWEGMPTLFMLLMLVSITESKSIAWIILFIGIFGWTSFARYVRSETLKIRPLAYIQACQTLGYSQSRTLFFHLLPNALSTVITLLPFAIMGAISAETGLSFLGLGEEGSSSWGVLMDEGRKNFPAESALLWPPALMLTLLLTTLAVLGDALRDALDPRLRA